MGAPSDFIWAPSESTWLALSGLLSSNVPRAQQARRSKHQTLCSVANPTIQTGISTCNVDARSGSNRARNGRTIGGEIKLSQLNLIAANSQIGSRQGSQTRTI